MAKVKMDGHIVSLLLNRYVCFTYLGNRTIFSLRYSKFRYFTLKIQGQDHNENQPKSNQVIYKLGPSTLPKMKQIWKIIAWKM